MLITEEKLFYTNSDWGDLLTEYNGQTIEYDNIGNPLYVRDAQGNVVKSYTWTQGRQLESLTTARSTWTYTYDANGLRTSRTNGTTTYEYIYAGDKLVRMIKNGEVIDFTYAGAIPMTMTYQGSTYYYVTNAQGDVVGITDSSGTLVIGYLSRAWGKVTYTAENAELAPILAYINPFIYRGYVYDIETALYYLQSRYYDPELGRFINADVYASTGQGVLGNNMFAYCGNNPTVFADPYGTYPSRDIFQVCLGFNDRPYELTLADYIATIAKPMDSTMDEMIEHTWSIGLTGNVTNGGVSLGKSYCISGDYYGSFALQETTSQGSSVGDGGSVGIYVSITNASDVQDLSGLSYSFGVDLFCVKGWSLEILFFEPTPGDVRWGITLVHGYGAGASASINENYTTSTRSWHIWDLFT